LTLEEITTVIDLYFQDSTGIRGKQKVLEILQFHLQETDEKLAALGDFRSDLQANILRIQQQIQELSSQ